MGLGVAAIAASVICLIASLTLDVPSWINLLGIGFGVLGLLLIGKGRRGGGGS